MKSNKIPKRTTVPLSTTTLIIPFSQTSQITAHTPASHKIHHFSLKGGWRRNSSIVTRTLLWPTKIESNSCRKEFHTARSCWQSQKRLSRSSFAFWQRKQEKGPTRRVMLLTSLSIVLIQPSKTCLIKNLAFLGTLILQTTSKTNSLKREGSRSKLNKDWHVKPNRTWNSNPFSPP